MRGVFSRVFSLMIVRLRINENDVRFGSKADIASRPRHVRLDIRRCKWDVRKVPNIEILGRIEQMGQRRAA
jgi:hypothetical protein